jgi:hypothetical protein
MNAMSLILCERTERWAAAIRLAIVRQGMQPAPRIREVRSLTELEAQLSARPLSLALVEVTRTNIADVLRLVVDASERHPAARFAALLNGGLCESSECRRAAVDALMEAGCCEFAASPRQLAGILRLARLHAARALETSRKRDNLSIEAWAWATLPWQAD